MRRPWVLLLGPHQAGDRLFISTLARSLRAFSGPLVFVHGPSEQADVLFAQTQIAAQRTGSLYQTATREAEEAVLRSVREWNRRLVALMTESGLPAVGIQGTDRRLLVRERELQVRDASWFWQIAASGARPVLSSLAWQGEAVYLEHPLEAALAIAEAHPEAEVVLCDQVLAHKLEQEPDWAHLRELAYLRDWRPVRFRAPLRVVANWQSGIDASGVVLRW